MIWDDETKLANKFVAVALVKVAFVLSNEAILPEFAIKEPIVPLVV